MRQPGNQTVVKSTGKRGIEAVVFFLLELERTTIPSTFDNDFTTSSNLQKIVIGHYVLITNFECHLIMGSIVLSLWIHKSCVPNVDALSALLSQVNNVFEIRDAEIFVIA